MGRYIQSEKLIGRIFNTLTVVRVIDVPEVRGRKLVCKCSCGAEVISTLSLLQGGSTSCDCQKIIEQKSYIGEKYNMLTLKSCDESNIKNVIVYCQCGETKSVDFRTLLLNKIKSCGCLTKSKNTVGEVYGRFTIIEDLPSIKYGTHNYKQVKVQCECGNVRNKCYKDLKRGSAKSCGCINAEIKIDIVENNIYNNWTILSEGRPYITGKGKIRTVNAKCICGKEKSNITLNSIVQGKSKSCGCQGRPKKVKEEKPIPISTEEEQWKEASGFKGYYISTKGNVFSNLSKKYLVSKNKTSLELNSNNEYRRFNISKVVYETFKGVWDENEYILLNIDDDIYNSSLDNLFLSRITNNGSNWVSRMFGGIAGNCTRDGQRRIKTRSITKADIIRQYQKQRGLSSFLKIEMDLTADNKLLAISIDRIDNDRDYDADNFTLVTRFENMGRGQNKFDEFKLFIEEVKSHLCNADTTTT